MRNKVGLPIRLAMILACLLSAAALHAQTLRGTVVHIVDGDTFDIFDDTGLKTRIRMQTIDAPERGQPLYKESKEYLRSLIDGLTVTIHFDKLDGFKRTVGRVYLWELDVEHEMLHVGMARHFLRFNQEKKLADAEMDARERKIGVWR